MQQQQLVQPMSKPSWRGLQGGGTTPVGEFVGTVGSWGLAQSQYGQQVVFKINQAQILHTDTPFPYAELDLSIKYSEAQNSGWGKFGESIARALGISMEVLDIDQLIGQVIHCVRNDNYTFFVDKSGQAAIGSYWELVQFVQPGTSVPSIFAQKNPVTGVPPNSNSAAAVPPMPPPALATPSNPGIPTPVIPTVPIPAPIPVPVVPVAVPLAPPVAPAVPVPATPVIPTAPDGNNAEEVAKQLLHGKTLSEFYRDAMQNPEIRANPSISQAIVMQAYVEGLKAQGVATENPDGTFSVVGM